MRRLALSLVTVTLLAACGGSGGGYSNGPTDPHPDGGPSTSNRLTVANNYFTPSTTTVPAGTTVTWTWNSCSNDPYGGTGCVEHSIVFDDGVRSTKQSGGNYEREFTAGGTYKYHCGVHGTAMSGSITVQ